MFLEGVFFERPPKGDICVDVRDGTSVATVSYHVGRCLVVPRTINGGGIWKTPASPNIGKHIVLSRNIDPDTGTPNSGKGSSTNSRTNESPNDTVEGSGLRPDRRWYNVGLLG